MQPIWTKSVIFDDVNFLTRNQRREESYISFPFINVETATVSPKKLRACCHPPPSCGREFPPRYSTLRERQVVLAHRSSDGRGKLYISPES